MASSPAEAAESSDGSEQPGHEHPKRVMERPHPFSLEYFSLLLFILTARLSEIPVDPVFQSHVPPDLLEASLNSPPTTILNGKMRRTAWRIPVYSP